MNVHKRIRTRIKKIQKNRKNNTLSRHIHSAPINLLLSKTNKHCIRSSNTMVRAYNVGNNSNIKNI